MLDLGVAHKFVSDCVLNVNDVAVICHGSQVVVLVSRINDQAMQAYPHMWAIIKAPSRQSG